MGNVIVPITAFTQRTKQLPLTVTSALTAWSTARAVGIFYADSAGVWRLAFNITGTFTSSGISAATITVTGVTFGASAQAVDGIVNAGLSSYAYTGASASTLNLAFSSSSPTALQISGDVELASNPTTYTTAANLEGNANVAAYFPPASGATAGLVDGNPATWNGAKTFSSAPIFSAGLNIAAAQPISFNNGVIVSGGTQTVSTAEYGSFTAYLVDGTNKSSGLTCYYSVIANMVTLSITTITLSSAAVGYLSLTTSNAAATYTWPTGLTPARASNILVRVTAAGTAQMGMLQVGGGTNAVPILYKDAAPNSWTAATNGISAITFSYLLN